MVFFSNKGFHLTKVICQMLLKRGGQIPFLEIKLSLWWIIKQNLWFHVHYFTFVLSFTKGDKNAYKSFPFASIHLPDWWVELGDDYCARGFLIGKAVRYRDLLSPSQLCKTTYNSAVKIKLLVSNRDGCHFAWN